MEENILEKLAWEEHSALYDALHSAGNIVPSCESVCFSQTFPSDASAASHSSSAILSSPSVQRPNFKIFGDKVVGYRKLFCFLLGFKIYISTFPFHPFLIYHILIHASLYIRNYIYNHLSLLAYFHAFIFLPTFTHTYLFSISIVILCQE